MRIVRSSHLVRAKKKRREPDYIMAEWRFILTHEYPGPGPAVRVNGPTAETPMC